MAYIDLEDVRRMMPAIKGTQQPVPHPGLTPEELASEQAKPSWESFNPEQYMQPSSWSDSFMNMMRFAVPFALPGAGPVMRFIERFAPQSDVPPVQVEPYFVGRDNVPTSPSWKPEESWSPDMRIDPPFPPYIPYEPETPYTYDEPDYEYLPSPNGGAPIQVRRRF